LTSRFLIYALCDPRNNQIRYVGFSTIGLRRPKQHWTKDKNKKDHCHAWIRSLLQENLIPEVEVLEELPTAEGIGDIERFWIASWKLMGANLTNMTDGGDGGLFGFKHRPETIELMSKNHDSPGMTGLKHSEETVEKIRRGNLGLKRSPKTVEAIRNSMMGNKNARGKRTPEQIENIRRGRWEKRNDS
jgi:hypothetical protein